MAAIRPISELRNNFSDIASICNEEGEGFITRNGFGAYVLRKTPSGSKILHY